MLSMSHWVHYQHSLHFVVQLQRSISQCSWLYIQLWHLWYTSMIMSPISCSRARDGLVEATSGLSCGKSHMVPKPCQWFKRAREHSGTCSSYSISVLGGGFDGLGQGQNHEPNGVTNCLHGSTTNVNTSRAEIVPQKKVPSYDLQRFRASIILGVLPTFSLSHTERRHGNSKI